MFVSIQNGDYAIAIPHIVGIEINENDLNVYMVNRMEFTIEDDAEIKTLLRLTGLEH